MPRGSSATLLGDPQRGVPVTQSAEGARRPDRPASPEGLRHPLGHRLAVVRRASDDGSAVRACDDLHAPDPVECLRDVVAAHGLGHLEEDVAPPAAFRLDDHAQCEWGNGFNRFPRE